MPRRGPPGSSASVTRRASQADEAQQAVLEAEQRLRDAEQQVEDARLAPEPSSVRDARRSAPSNRSAARPSFTSSTARRTSRAATGPSRRSAGSMPRGRSPRCSPSSLDEAAGEIGRAVILTVAGNRLRGWEARGFPDVVASAIDAPVEPDSIFGLAISTGLPASTADAPFAADANELASASRRRPGARGSRCRLRSAAARSRSCMLMKAATGCRSCRAAGPRLPRSWHDTQATGSKC